MGEVEVLNDVKLATIQDKGRDGFRHLGVPVSGVMDQKSFDLGNALLGNNANAAVIEWSIKGPALLFKKATFIALTGAKTKAFLNGNEISFNKKIFVPEQSKLKLNFTTKNVYSYIAIKGGFLTPIVLGSRSFYKGITTDFFVGKNDRLPYKEIGCQEPNFTSIRVPEITNEPLLDCHAGPEFKRLSTTEKEQLLTQYFTISITRSRMGIQLEEILPNTLSEMITSPVLPGTIQLTSGGKLIVLMRDCQTTGGYPRVLILTDEAINTIAQIPSKKRFRFRMVDLD
ncbi:5-oxoprolinase subunit C family protein [Aquimarina rhabdastrellae]